MVAGAAALLVVSGDVLVAHFDAGFSSRVLRADPIRIIEAVITGVSFLGAGTIIRRQAEPHVEGLTTAASILLAAAVGICVALSRTTLATGVTVLALVVLRRLRWGEQRMGIKGR
ncbi:MAG: MgtC/SapB family protein [Nitrospirales bacterium]